MKLLLTALVILPAMIARSQQKIDVGKDDVKIPSGSFYVVGEELVTNAKYVKLVEGTPYFSPSWMRGTVIMSRGSRYDSILLRLDLLDNSLQYLTPEGKEMISTSPVKTIILTDSLSGAMYTFEYSVYLNATNQIENAWYQLLADGQVSLYKRVVKTLKENKPYSSATYEQTISDEKQYYLFTNSVFTKIKKLKDIAEMFPDKKDQLLKYINSKNLSGRSDRDYSGLVEYCNGLLGR